LIARLLSGDTLLATLFAVLGAVWIAGALGMPAWDGFTPGPGWMPMVFGAALLLLSLMAGVQAVLAGGTPAAEPVRKPLAVAAIILAGVLGLEVAGFVPAIFLMLLALLASVERKPLLPALAVAAGTAAFLHLVFARWLSVPLPAGPLGF
jgi:hypothetical protein